MKDVGLSGKKFVDFRVETTFGLLSQDNGFDYGIFVMKFMESQFNRELVPLMVKRLHMLYNTMMCFT